MTTQKQETHTVPVANGPGSERIIHSLHSLILGEQHLSVVAFELGSAKKPWLVQLVITEIGIIEGIEGAAICMKGAFPEDARRFCPPRQREREEREFIFTNYNHHSRNGAVQIPLFYLSRFLNFCPPDSFA